MAHIQPRYNTFSGQVDTSPIEKIFGHLETIVDSSMSGADRLIVGEMRALKNPAVVYEIRGRLLVPADADKKAQITLARFEIQPSGVESSSNWVCLFNDVKFSQDNFPIIAKGHQYSLNQQLSVLHSAFPYVKTNLFEALPSRIKEFGLDMNPIELKFLYKSS